MKIKDIMAVDVEVVDRDASLCECAYIMRSADVGGLPVVAEGELVGVITDRDIVVRALAEELDCSGTKVRLVMTPDVVTCREDMDSGEARRLMSAHRIRRLVVVDGEGQLTGILTQSDLSARSDAEAVEAAHAV
ncbi:MAG: CBS domain-containing protein [Elusimicrobia bacterium]|nr:CBS domain-containing protein [Elusimicrobiota bacterium]